MSTDVFSKQTQRQIDETLPSNHVFQFEHEGCPYELGTLNTGKYYLFKHDKVTGYATHGLICNNIFALFKAMKG
jgi:hypothetical protein